MYHIEPFFPEKEDPVAYDQEPGSLLAQKVLDCAIVEKDTPQKYHTIARAIIENCSEDPNNIIHFFDTVCRDFSNPSLVDRTESFEMVMSVLAGTYALDSVGALNEYLADRYKEDVTETPALCQLLIRTFEVLDSSDIPVILKRSSFEAVFRKAIQLNSSEQAAYACEKDLKEILGAFLEHQVVDREDIFRLSDTYLDIASARDQGEDQSPVPDNISKILVDVAMISAEDTEEVINYFESLITSEDAFFAEIAGYGLATLHYKNDRLGETEIFERLRDGFEQAEDLDKEFWTIALGEFCCYDKKRAQQCIDLLHPLTEGPDEFRVSYVSETIAKIVNQVGGIWRSVPIEDIGKQLMKDEGPAYTISNNQRCIFIAKVIGAIDKENYKQAICDIEDLFLTLAGTENYTNVVNSVMAGFGQVIDYFADEIHEEILFRAERAVQKATLTPEIAELYGLLLKLSFDCIINSDAADRVELSNRYSQLSTRLNAYLGVEKFSSAIHEIDTRLAYRLFGFKD